MSEVMIEARELDEALRRRARARQGQHEGAPRRGARLPRPERRRQVDHDEDPDLLHRADRGHGRSSTATTSWTTRSRRAPRSATCPRATRSTPTCSCSSTSSSWPRCAASRRPKRASASRKSSRRPASATCSPSRSARSPRATASASGLAQALVHEPPILILDEPMSGLDPNQAVEIRDLIKDIGRERTVILSTHNLRRGAGRLQPRADHLEGQASSPTTRPTACATAPARAASWCRSSIRATASRRRAKAACAPCPASSACAGSRATPGELRFEVLPEGNEDLRPAAVQARRSTRASRSSVWRARARTSSRSSASSPPPTREASADASSAQRQRTPPS